jgi:hypothetical protein
MRSVFSRLMMDEIPVLNPQKVSTHACWEDSSGEDRGRNGPLPVPIDWFHYSTQQKLKVGFSGREVRVLERERDIVVFPSRCK